MRRSAIPMPRQAEPDARWPRPSPRGRPVVTGSPSGPTRPLTAGSMSRTCGGSRSRRAWRRPCRTDAPPSTAAPPSRLRSQSAHQQANRGTLRLDQGYRPLKQDYALQPFGTALSTKTNPTAGDLLTGPKPATRPATPTTAPTSLKSQPQGSKDVQFPRPVRVL